MDAICSPFLCADMQLPYNILSPCQEIDLLHNTALCCQVIKGKCPVQSPRWLLLALKWMTQIPFWLESASFDCLAWNGMCLQQLGVWSTAGTATAGLQQWTSACLRVTQTQDLYFSMRWTSSDKFYFALQLKQIWTDTVYVIVAAITEKVLSSAIGVSTKICAWITGILYSNPPVSEQSRSWLNETKSANCLVISKGAS